MYNMYGMYQHKAITITVDYGYVWCMYGVAKMAMYGMVWLCMYVWYVWLMYVAST
jgi:hypothetical protein